MRRRRNTWDVIVIGGGIAGLTAAWHAAQHGLATALVEKAIGFGGQVATVNQLHGWPSTETLSGYALATATAEQGRRAGVELICQDATSIAHTGSAILVRTPEGVQRARRTIVATGARPRPLGIGEDVFHGKGFSHCADCDGPLHRDSDVVVVGAGDSAFQEALILSSFCRSVTVIIRSSIRARRSYIERVAGTTNIKLLWNSVIDEVKGRDAVSSVVVRNLKSNMVSEIACSGVFPFVGVIPNAEILPHTVSRDEQGFVAVDQQFRTSEPAIRAVGALRSQFPGQLVNAAAEGAAAVIPIVRELTGRL